MLGYVRGVNQVFCLIHSHNMMDSAPGLPNFMPSPLAIKTEVLNVGIEMEAINDVSNFNDITSRKPFMKRRAAESKQVHLPTKTKQCLFLYGIL